MSDERSAPRSDESETDRSFECVGTPNVLKRHTRALKLVLGISVSIMLVEVVGGFLANSLALLADAGHMLTDAAAIALALFAAWIAERPATAEKTFGLLRLEILAALANGTVLLGLAAVIIWHAIGRLQAAPEVEPRILFGVATVGLVANLVALRILHGGHKHSLNVRGAYLHVLGDLLGSVGALSAGIIIITTGWTLADPLISIAIALLILVGAWRLVGESVDVLLEATPRHISMEDVAGSIASIPGVSDVHDLHVWTVTSGVVAMSGHAVVSGQDKSQGVLELVHSRMRDLGINHVTMQIEQDETTCRPIA